MLVPHAEKSLAFTGRGRRNILGNQRFSMQNGRVRIPLYKPDFSLHFQIFRKPFPQVASGMEQMCFYGSFRAPN